MLIGQHGGKVDAKGRAAFPKVFREILGDVLFLTFGYDGSLIAVSEENWKELLAGTEGRPFIDAGTREVQRYHLGGSTRIELDAKGRVAIPGYLREFAKIGSDVIFLGLSSYVEVWDKVHWEEYRKSLEGNIETVAQKLFNEEKKSNE